MISDLLKIFQAIQSAESVEEKQRLEQELLLAVQGHIGELYKDSRYPHRRRSFGAIRKSLQIYNDKQGKLRDILFAMGARPVKGDGEDALWELPKKTGLGINPPARKPPRNWSRIYKALAIAFVGIAVGGWLLSRLGSTDPVICSIEEMTLEELEICELNGGVLN